MAAAIVISIFASLVLFYFYLTRNYKYWQKRGIPCVEDPIVGIGNMWDFLTTKETLSNLFRKFYNQSKGSSMVGFYNFTSPALIVRDPELVKAVLQTNFGSFHANAISIDPSLDPLLANHPIFTYGEKWQLGRKRLAYAFSGVRLKILLESVKKVCVQFEDYLTKKMNNVPRIEVELKDLLSRFTAQVVCSAGFGVDGYCFDEKREHESFLTIGNSFLAPSFINNIMVNIIFFIPAVNKILRVSVLPKKAENFFKTLVTDVMEQRRKDTTIKAHDFLQLMVDMERMEGDKYDLDVLTTHALSFFIDGYETTSSVLSFICFHLASQPEVQKKLREEVTSVLDKYNGALTYEGLKEMTYMDNVISEAERITPTVGLLLKECTEDIELKGSDGLVCHVERGTQIVIPVHGLHEDNQHWENPDVYDPERFNADNKHNIQRFAFLPFGEGPRLCPGQRMAQLQMKAFLTTFLRKYSLKLSPKTQLPLKFTVANFINAAVGGLWAYIEPL